MRAINTGSATVQKATVVNQVSAYAESLVAVVEGQRTEIALRHLECYPGEVLDIEIEHSGKTVEEALDELPLGAFVYAGSSVYTKEGTDSYSHGVWEWVKDTADKEVEDSGYW